MDEGHASLKLLKKVQSAEALGIAQLARLNFLVKLFDVARMHQAEPLRGPARIGLWGPLRRRLEHIPKPGPVAGRVRNYRQADLGRCLELLNAYQKNPALKFARIWEAESLSKQLEFQDLAFTQVYEKEGNIEGLFNYYILPLRGKVTVKVGVMENVYFGNMSPEERSALLAAVLKQVVSEGCAAMVGCNFQYYDQQVLRSARFLSYPGYAHFFARGDPDLVRTLRPLKAREICFDQK